MNDDVEKQHLLMVEDDEGLQRQLKWSFSDYNVTIAINRAEATAALRRFQPAVVTLDLGLPPDPTNVSEGFATLEEILSLAPETKIIVITGNDDRDNAVKAVALGAYDFYQKPIDPEIIKIIINRAYKLYQLEKDHRLLQQRAGRSPLEGLITADDGMLKVCRTIEKVAPTDTTIMLIGESGTGKEILARALHELNNSKNKKFVAINCAAIPENLLESELFGYEKGAFTGANKQTIGKVEMANGGTLFLDEIGDLSMLLQAKLLRFLQERVIERVGGREEIPVDVRVVSATHRDIKGMIDGAQFREDLFYRLCEITINIPPLRERSSDAVILARHFLVEFSNKSNRAIKGITQDGLIAIENHDWPGNVRELESTIKKAVIMAESAMLTDKDLGFEIPEDNKLLLNLRETREKAEKEAVSHALSYASGNISKTAELLGVSRPTLYDIMSKYGLK